MASTFFGLNIAVSGMNTYNAVLNTTAHNISNTKTKGFKAGGKPAGKKCIVAQNIIRNAGYRC